MPGTELKFSDYERLNPFGGSLSGSGSVGSSSTTNPFAGPGANLGSHRGGGSLTRRNTVVLIASVVIVVITTFAFDLGGISHWHQGLGAQLHDEQHVTKAIHDMHIGKLQKQLRRERELRQHEEMRLKEDFEHKQQQMDAQVENHIASIHQTYNQQLEHLSHHARTNAQQAERSAQEAAALKEQQQKHRTELASIAHNLVKHGQAMITHVGSNTALPGSAGYAAQQQPQNIYPSEYPSRGQAQDQMWQQPEGRQQQQQQGKSWQQPEEIQQQQAMMQQPNPFVESEEEDYSD